MKTDDCVDKCSIVDLSSRAQKLQQSNSSIHSLSKSDQCHSNSNLSLYKASNAVNHYHMTGNTFSLTKQHHSLKHNKTKNKGKHGGSSRKSSMEKSFDEDVHNQQTHRLTKKNNTNESNSSDDIQLYKSYY